jgi:ribosomal protein L5
MYIAFDLPRTNGGIASWMNHILHQELKIWYQKHTIAYQIKTVKYVTRVVLEPDEMYSFFAMTWNPINPALRNYRVVEPMSLDNH